MSTLRRLEIAVRAATLVAAALPIAFNAGGWHAAAAIASPSSSPFLFVWAADEDGRDTDFLAVVDALPGSASYGSVVRTVPVGVNGTRAHHTEHEMPSGGVLFANGFNAGRTFRFDLRSPTSPRLLGSFTDAGPLAHPHSFVRLPDGHVLATFQIRAGGGEQMTGGLAELDADGQTLRVASAAVPEIDPGVRPYSLAVLPALDRVVTTATDMHGLTKSSAVQIWRLSDLSLLQTLLLPPGPRGDENLRTAEPRVLADGRTVMVNTFQCGLYRITGLDGRAWAEWVYTPQWEPNRNCAIPVRTGQFWLQTVAAQNAVVSLDISDPSKPREVSRVTLGGDEDPHWIAIEPNGERIVITGYRGLLPWVMIATFDQGSGRLDLDRTFREPGAGHAGVFFGRRTWPHGETGAAIPHGAVFSRP